MDILDPKIVPTPNGTYLVRGTTERFGRDEILFESWSWDECIQYLEKNGITYAGTQKLFPIRVDDKPIVARYPNLKDPDRSWLVKKYRDGHYFLNEEVNGQLTNRYYTRMSKDQIQTLIFS